MSSLALGLLPAGRMTGIAFRHLYSATVSIDHSTANLEKVLKREKDVGRGSERIEDGQAFHRLGRVMAMDLAVSWVFCGPNYSRTKRTFLSKEQKHH